MKKDELIIVSVGVIFKEIVATIDLAHPNISQERYFELVKFLIEKQVDLICALNVQPPEYTEDAPPGSEM